MNNAADRRARRRLLHLVLVAFVVGASHVRGGVNVWTTHGPTGGDVRALAVEVTAIRP